MFIYVVYKLVSRPDFFKGRGRPLLFSSDEFFALSFEDGLHVLDAHCG